MLFMLLERLLNGRSTSLVTVEAGTTNLDTTLDEGSHHEETVLLYKDCVEATVLLVLHNLAQHLDVTNS